MDNSEHPITAFSNVLPIMKSAICLSHTRDKAIQIKKMFNHMGVSDVQTSTFTKLPDFDDGSIVYIDYSYENSPTLCRIIDTLVERNCMVILHHLERSELFIEEILVKHPYNVINVSGYLSINTLKDKISKVQGKLEYLTKFQKIESFALSADVKKLASITNVKVEVANFILTILLSKRESIYPLLLQVTNANKLNLFHYLNYVKEYGYPKNDRIKTDRLVKDKRFAYYANKAVALREFEDKNYSSCIAYASDALSRNPLDFDLLSLIASCSAITGNVEQTLGALKLRQRYSIFTIDDLKRLVGSILSNLIASDASLEKLVNERKRLTSAVKGMERKFGLANKAIFKEIINLLSVFFLIRSNKKEAAVIIYNKNKKSDYGEILLVLINKLINSEIGNIKDSHLNFNRFKELSSDNVEQFKLIYRHNQKEHNYLLNGYRSLTKNKKDFDENSIMTLYEKYPLSLELNMLISRKFLLKEGFIKNENTRKTISNNIRMLSSIRNANNR